MHSSAKLSASETSSEPSSRINRLLVRLGSKVFPWRLSLGLAGVAIGAVFIRPDSLFGQYETIGTAASLGLVLFGLGLRAWGSGTAGTHTRTGTIEAPQLITSGPFAYVRNPIYLGSILLGFGMVGLLGDARLVAVCIIIFSLMYLVIIPAEEQFLRSRFTQEYDLYCAQVPRLLPRLRPWHDSETSCFDWRGTKGEALIAFLLTGIYCGLRALAHLRTLN